MKEPAVRWKMRFRNYCDALETLSQIIPRYKNLSTIEEDGLIQRFEFTFELCWKVMQDYLLQTGYKGLKGPRNVITQMATDNLLDQFVWVEMMLARNELSHIYDEKKSCAYLDKIILDYTPAFIIFKENMQKLL